MKKNKNTYKKNPNNQIESKETNNLNASIPVLLNLPLFQCWPGLCFFYAVSTLPSGCFLVPVCACNAFQPSSVKLVIAGLLSTVYKECASLEPSATVHPGWLDSIFGVFDIVQYTPPEVQAPVPLLTLWVCAHCTHSLYFSVRVHDQ